jgi:hypothetical protein
MKGKLFFSFLTKDHYQKFEYFLIIFRTDGYIKFLTKGDDNPIDDRALYSPGQLWLERKDIIGNVKGYASYLSFMIKFFVLARHLDTFHT